MLKRLLLALIILTISATVSEAGPFAYLQEQEYYVALTGGFGIPTTADMDFRSDMGSRDGDADFNTGFGMSTAMGVHLGESWRFEVEYSFRLSDYDSFTGSGTFPADPLEGDFSRHNFMFNLLYDINFDMNYYWYGGVGIGFSRSKLDLVTVNGSDSSINFAFQFMTGVGYRLTQDTSLYFGYRVLGSAGQNYRFASGTTRINADLHGPNFMHIFEAGVRFDF